MKSRVDLEKSIQWQQRFKRVWHQFEGGIGGDSLLIEDYEHESLMMVERADCNNAGSDWCSFMEKVGVNLGGVREGHREETSEPALDRCVVSEFIIWGGDGIQTKP